MNTSIVVCGKKFDIGTKVVLWNETNGLNAYDESRVITWQENRKTGKGKKKILKGKRYKKRNISLSKLQRIITQFFLHHSGLYHSEATFSVLHKERGLSAHFIMDDDGTIYQMLDLKEIAWHGGSHNKFSIGIEIDSRARAYKIPNAYDEQKQKKYNVGPRNKRLDKIHGEWLEGFEYNDRQYEALICLGVGIKEIFPLVRTPNSPYEIDFPRTKDGEILKTTYKAAKEHRGFICHLQASKSNKIDPISFDFSRFIEGVELDNPWEESTFLRLDDWKERQTFLKLFGFDPGLIDGIFGPKTKSAVEKCQKEFGLPQNGEWSDKMTYMFDVKFKSEQYRSAFGFRPTTFRMG